jgi:hypothetical protein
MTNNGQSAAKPLNVDNTKEEGSTTIPQGSTGSNSGKWQLYTKIRHVIYKITCSGDNKFYIGSATYYAKRMDKHFWGLKNNKHVNPYMQNAYNKYGANSFSCEILEYCTMDNLIEREQYWLDLTQCYDRTVGFNISKIAESKRGTKMPESAKIAIGNFWRGKKFSQERINNIRLARTREQGKTILCYDKDMNLVGEFVSISETARQLNVSISAISKQCSRKNGFKKSKNSNFIFRYKDIV